ncbi:tripartite tricarboxylate transporter TctB family protein [Microvirga puerhi]|uniref:Tripartite tricarboxylate transporter TctB family protein n=1 Tax=Microvirga puerhi TaxID=2876078 RepID=A0ABS7VL09_9HYPH|nr:tripartite tricarboxylate transporter TctB family protein [Microvirga puerhi]MBZ6076184.1 tripartite tricarboxylate transporter TctB family protein [Microvirga puerhi]
MSMSQERVRERRGLVRSSQNLAAGLFLVFIAALALWLTGDLPQGRLGAMGPGMLPDWLAYAVGLCGLALAGSGLLKEGDSLEAWGLRGPFFVILAVVAFAVTIRPFSLGPLVIPGLGMIVAGPLAIVIGGYATSEAQFRPLLVLALGLTPFCMVLFGDLLNLPIPIFPQALADLLPATWSQKAILRLLAALMVLAAAAMHLSDRGRKSRKIDVVRQPEEI